MLRSWVGASQSYWTHAWFHTSGSKWRATDSFAAFCILYIFLKISTHFEWEPCTSVLLFWNTVKSQVGIHDVSCANVSSSAARAKWPLISCTRTRRIKDIFHLFHTHSWHIDIHSCRTTHWQHRVGFDQGFRVAFVACQLGHCAAAMSTLLESKEALRARALEVNLTEAEARCPDQQSGRLSSSFSFRCVPTRWVPDRWTNQWHFWNSRCA